MAVAPDEHSPHPPLLSLMLCIPGKSGTFVLRLPKNISNADWQLYPGDLPDLQSPERVIFIGWWYGGYPLLLRYAVEAQSSRLKYWRKVTREGKLPPVLIWYVSGINQTLISLCQIRYGRPSRNRAILGDGHLWEEDISCYLHRHRDTGLLTPLLQRTEDTV